MKAILLGLLYCLALTSISPAGELEWRETDDIEAFHFQTPLLQGQFVAHDGRDLGRGYALHGFRDLVYRGQDLHAPEGEVGAKRRHNGILNLYRVYSATETFGSLRDDKAEVKRLEDGARLTWPASAERPVEMIVTWTLTGDAQIDVEVVALPTKDLMNFEVLPATYLPVEMVKGLYLGTSEDPQLVRLQRGANEPEAEDYVFYPMRESARAAVANSGRVNSDWTWPSAVGEELATLPILFAESDDFLVLQFANPESVSAVCVTSTPEAGKPEDWSGVEKHSALYYSLFGHDVEAGESYKTHMRFLVLDTEESSPEQILTHYEEFLR